MTAATSENALPPPAKTTFPITRLGMATNYFLAIILVVTLISGPVALINLISPHSLLTVIPLVCGFIALEAMLTTRWLFAPHQRQINRPAYRLAELVVILVVLRLLVWALEGGLPPVEQFYDYLLNPLILVNGLYLAFVFFGFIAWERAVTFTMILNQLSLSEAEIAFYGLPSHKQSIQTLDRPVDSERPKLFQKLISNWLLGGLLFILCAGLTTFRVPEADSEGVMDFRNISRLGLQPAILISMVIYFLTGFWLVARARLIALRTRWIVGNIQVHPGISRVWNGASLLLLLAVAGLATLLPIGSTTGAARILGAVSGILLFLINIILLLISLVIFLLLSLLGRNLEQLEGNGAIEPILPPTPVPPAPPNETVAIILGFLFWVVIIVVVLAAFIFFLRGRGVRLEVTVIGTTWQRFVAWLRGLWRGAAGRMEALNLGLRRSKKEDAARSGRDSPWRFIRVNALSAQAQIRYFYLSTIRRAGERGVNRKESETPTEFAEDLKDSWPDIEMDIEALTDAFLRARYSADRIVKDDVSPVKKTWQRVRSSIRHRRQKKENQT